MAKRRSNARLFEPDGYTFKCWIDPLDALDRYNRGEIDLAVNSVTGEPIGYRLRASFQTSDPNHPRSSESSITLRETLLNVGLSGRPHEQPSRAAVEAAQRKVAVWPFIRDDKAVLAAVKV